MQDADPRWYDGVHSVSPSGYIWLRRPYRQMPFDTDDVLDDDGVPLETVILTSANWMDDVSFQVGYQRPAQTTYRVLEKPLLFREFADLWCPVMNDEFAENVIRFANQHGRISGSAQVYFHRRVPDDALIRTRELPEREGRYVLAMGDGLASWHTEVEAMKAATGLWDLIVANKSADVARCIERQDDGTIEYRGTDELHWHALIGGRLTPEELASFNWDGTILEAAEMILIKSVYGHMSTTGDQTTARLVRDPETRQNKIVHVPGSLNGALWLQLAQAIERRSPYRRCVECRRWFTFDPKKIRNGVEKIYCSKACKMKRYHRTQRESAGAVDAGTQSD